jgi:hypothetical protein
VPDSTNGRLDSWKEIAEYLGRDVRTLLRWEKEKGLPVHTVPGGKRRTVYAFKHEIDAWLAKEQPAEENQQSAIDQPLPTQMFWRRVPAAIWAALGLVLLGFAAFGAYRWREISSPTLTSILQEGNRLVAISPNSSVAWTYEFPGGPANVLKSLVVPNPHKNGAAGVLVTVGLGERSGDALYFFSPRGQPVWQFQSNDTVSFSSGDHKLSWGFNLIGTLQQKDETKILLTTRGYTWWPSQVLVLNMRGEVESRFINSGWIDTISIIESPRGRMLAAGGVNNSHNGGAVALLDASGFSGSSPEEPGSAFECKSCPPGRPLKYFVIPRSELNVISGSSLYPAGGEPAGSTVLVSKHELPGSIGQPPPASIIEFSLDFQLHRASYDDHYWEWHRKLEIEGKLAHSREKCPERDGPPFIREWTPEHGWREIRAPRR